MTLLERLYRARAKLSGFTLYQFNSWSTCTCGHIYRAATDRFLPATQYAVRYDNNSTYRDMLRAITEANGVVLEADCTTYDLARAISDLTVATARAEGIGRRKAALVLVGKAIRVEEAAQEEARLQVLAQAQAVIDNVDVREIEKV